MISLLNSVVAARHGASALPGVAEWIRVTGAREHNLRDVDIDIPKRQLTVVTGVSGSGKSSLVFDTVAVEAQRQLHELSSAFVRGFPPSFGRPAVDTIENLPAVITVDQRRLGGGARSTVGTITDIAPILRLLFSRAGVPHVGHSDAFSFNLPAGMCPRCEGRGETTDVDLGAFLDPSRSLNGGALLAPPFAVGSRNWQLLVSSGRLDPDKPVGDYDAEERENLLYSTTGSVEMEAHARSRQPRSRFTTVVSCPSCGGSRLSPLALESKIDGYRIADLAAMEAQKLLDVLATFRVPDAAPVLAALATRVGHLVDIGLGYLSLDRRTGSLSGGESQRIKIVRHLASSLNDMLYVFDEPSIGLHPRDVQRLTSLLRSLRDKGNTVLVVEHDRDVIAAADHVIDMGPGAGSRGGRVAFVGDVAALRRSETATGRHMTARTRLRDRFREPTGHLTVTGARLHNLRDLDLTIPTGVVVAVTGVAGAGKSTLIHDVFCAQHPEAAVVDQSAPNANRRSTTATYTGVADPIRQAFARATGVSAALFSANSAGACPDCEGLGVIHVDLAHVDGVTSTCRSCAGRRFTDEVLSHRLHGRSIGDVLEMTVAEAHDFFAEHRKIAPVLRTLADVGLDYLRLGQPLTSLSGGECQRIKLASQLHRSGGLYVLDEPTTGLHLADISRLLDVLDRIVDDHGGTVVVIEHNLDVVAHADWVVDLGPEGGSGGGEILFSGRPTDLLDVPGSHTGEYLRRALAPTTTSGG